MSEAQTDGLVVHDLKRPARDRLAAARQRYRIAKYLCVLLALAAAAYVVWLSALPNGLTVATQDKSFDLQSATLLVVAVAVPWLRGHPAVAHRTRRRNFWEWQ